MDIFVTIPDNASIHLVRFVSNPADEVALLMGDARHVDGLDADKDDDLVEAWQVGEEMGECGWDPSCQFSVYDAYTGSPDNPKTRPKWENPFHGYPVLYVC